MINLTNLPTRLKQKLDDYAGKRNLTRDQAATELIIEVLNRPMERRRPENTNLRSLIQDQQKKPA